MAELNGIIYKDISYDSQMSFSGELVTVEGKDALENAMRLWITSFLGERIRHPDWGGLITRWLYKLMTPDVEEEIRLGVTLGLQNEFSDVMKLTNVSVSADYEDKLWHIEVSAYLLRTNEEVYVIENLRMIA